MHVLVVPSWYPADSEDLSVSYMREQAQALVEYGGHKVGVIFPQLSQQYSFSGFPGFSQIRVCQETGVSTYRSHALNWFRRIPYVGAYIWIREGMRLFEQYVKENGRPDLIHAHVIFYGGVLAHRISEKYGIPFVITEHNSGYARGFVKPWQLALGAKAVKSAAACIAVGEKFAALLDDTYKFPSGSWKYIPNMVSGRFFEHSLAGNRGPNSTEFRFCTVCTLNPNKGVDFLIRAFAASFRGQKTVRLVLGGGGPDLFSLEQLVASSGIADQVSFLGPLRRDQVVDLIAHSDAFVLPSHYETFGVVLVEALALGKPVVATRCGGPESIVRPSDGFLVDKSNVQALASAMQSLLEGQSDYCPHQIRESCWSRFSAQSVVSRITDVYEQAKLGSHKT